MTLLFTGWDTADATGEWYRNIYTLHAARAQVTETGAPGDYVLRHSGSPFVEVPAGGPVPELICRTSVERPYLQPVGNASTMTFRIESDVTGLFSWSYDASWQIATSYFYPDDGDFIRTGALSFTWLGQTVTGVALATYSFPEAKFVGEVRWSPDDDVAELRFSRPVDQAGTNETVTLSIASPSGTPTAGTYAGWEITVRNSAPELAIGQDAAGVAQPAFTTAGPTPPATSFMVRGISVVVCGDEQC